LTEARRWRRCSACKKSIDFGATYWVCNVSTCNRKRTGLAFCTVSCWEVHLPSANHREAWALEKQAPTEQEAAAGPGDAREKNREQRRIARSTSAPGETAAVSDVLIVASRLKDYIRTRSGMSSSDRVLGPLSEIVRRACDEAIQNASREGRQTVLDRDIPRS
jgi:hypothetical protein